jgi:hypothetical protein
MNKISTILKILLPKNVLDIISFLYGLFIKENSYASDGEDLLIVKYFKHLKIVNGTYLDIGAYHPTWLSKHIYYIKWDGRDMRWIFQMKNLSGLDF